MNQQQLDHHNYRSQAHHKEIILLCTNVQSPANVGALFRLADAFAVNKLVFTTPIDLTSHRLQKMARGTHKIVPYEYVDHAISTLLKYKEDDYALLALELTTTSIPIMEFPKNHSKLVLIVGNEKFGIPQDILNITTNAVHIPMFGNNSSMNVAQATAIALYELSNTPL